MFLLKWPKTQSHAWEQNQVQFSVLELLNQNNERKQTHSYLVDIKYLSSKEQLKTNAITRLIAERALS